MPKNLETIFSIYNPLADDDTPTHDLNEMAKVAKDYHEKLQHKDRNPATPPDQAKVDRILENVPARTTPKQKNELAKFLSWNNIHQATNEQANDKAAGLDGIPIELWKKMSTLFDSCCEPETNPYCNIISMLTKTFNDIEKHGIAPSTNFNKGWMCPL